MSFFSNLTGAPDEALLRTGRLGRGLITNVQLTGTTVKGGTLAEHVCLFTIEVTLDRAQPYDVTVRQQFPEVRLSEIVAGATIVAVRVDPSDPTRVVIDWATPAPTVTYEGKPGAMTAADLLQHGDACEAVIIANQPLGMRNSSGVDLYALALTVIVPHKVPYQIQVGNPVPAEATALLFPGSRLPAKVDPGQPNSVAIDWSAALDSYR